MPRPYTTNDLGETVAQDKSGRWQRFDPVENKFGGFTTPPTNQGSTAMSNTQQTPPARRSFRQWHNGLSDKRKKALRDLGYIAVVIVVIALGALGWAAYSYLRSSETQVAEQPAAEQSAPATPGSTAEILGLTTETLGLGAQVGEANAGHIVDHERRIDTLESNELTAEEAAELKKKLEAAAALYERALEIQEGIKAPAPGPTSENTTPPPASEPTADVAVVPPPASPPGEETEVATNDYPAGVTLPEGETSTAFYMDGVLVDCKSAVPYHMLDSDGNVRPEYEENCPSVQLAADCPYASTVNMAAALSGVPPCATSPVQTAETEPHELSDEDYSELTRIVALSD